MVMTILPPLAVRGGFLPWRIGATSGHPRGWHRVAFRIAQTISHPFADRVSSRPDSARQSRKPVPTTCPRDSTLDVVEQAARRLRGRRIRRPREVDRFLDGG